MVDPLIVDTSRLEAAGDTLRSLALPPSPAGVTVAGTDAMSAAINATMPVVESPVVEGLPAAQAALQSTATKMISAATTYANVDQSLGEQLANQQFLAGDAPAHAAPTSSGAAVRTAATPAAGPAAAAAADSAAALDAETAAQPNQLAATAGSAIGGVQGAVQSIQGAFSSMSASGGQPASGGPSQPGTDAKPAGQDDEQKPETSQDGAAPGEQVQESVPLQDAEASVRQPSPVRAASGSGGKDAVE
jgi:hypothetical protein